MCAAFALHSCQGTTYKQEVLKEELVKRFHGSQNVSSQAEDLINGRGHYQRLQKKVDANNTGLSSEESWVTVLHEDYRREKKPLIYGSDPAKANLTLRILQQSKLSDANSTIKGGTLLKFARDEIREARKIQSCMDDAVKASIVTFTDGYYQFASGMNDSDLIHFLFFQMKNWDLFHGPSGRNDESDSDGEEEVGEQCEMTWFPNGWFLFWLVGNHPSNDPEFQINLSGMDDATETNGKKGGGRKEQRKNDKKEKDAARDCAVANGNEGRGLGYGATSIKELAVIEQSERKLDQQQVAAEIAGLSALLKSKHDSIASIQNDVKQCVQLGMIEDAKDAMKTLKDKRSEIATIEKDMQDLVKLQRENENQSAHTKQFLKLGAEATRMGKSMSGKKRAADEISELTGKSNESKEEGDNNSDDEDDEED